jgi:hypothetical protein
MKTPSYKSLAFWLGFAGWFAVGYAIAAAGGLDADFRGELTVTYAFCVFVPLNLIGLIVLGLIPKTRLTALGVMCAIVVNALVALVMGLFVQALFFIPVLFDASAF